MTVVEPIPLNAVKEAVNFSITRFEKQIDGYQEFAAVVLDAFSKFSNLANDTTKIVEATNGLVDSMLEDVAQRSREELGMRASAWQIAGKMMGIVLVKYGYNVEKDIVRIGYCDEVKRKIEQDVPADTRLLVGMCIQGTLQRMDEELRGAVADGRRIDETLSV